MSRLVSLLFLVAASCQQKKPPRVMPVLRTDDPRLSMQQDTLLLEGKPLSGYIISFHPNGDTAWFEARVHGVEHGPSLRWHANGQRMEERMYEKGRKTGIHRGWWPNGNQQFEYMFTDGEHNGPMLEWYEDGTPLKAFHHKMGHEEGQQRMWWANGSLRANYTVRNGRRYGRLGLKHCINPIDSLP